LQVREKLQYEIGKKLIPYFKKFAILVQSFTLRHLLTILQNSIPGPNLIKALGAYLGA